MKTTQQNLTKDRIEAYGKSIQVIARLAKLRQAISAKEAQS